MLSPGRDAVDGWWWAPPLGEARFVQTILAGYASFGEADAPRGQIMPDRRKCLVAGILAVTLSAAALSGCAPPGAPLPHFSQGDVESGKLLPHGVLPNGVVTEPWFQ